MEEKNRPHLIEVGEDNKVTVTPLYHEQLEELTESIKELTEVIRELRENIKNN